MAEKNLNVSASSLKETQKCSGYLIKRGAIVKNWKKRWCVLTTNHLYYYKSNKATKAQGVINLNNSSEVLTDNFLIGHTKVSEHRRKNIFALKTASRTFYLNPSSPEEKQNWVIAIQGVLDNIKNPTPKEKTEEPKGETKEETKEEKKEVPGEKKDEVQPEKQEEKPQEGAQNLETPPASDKEQKDDDSSSHEEEKRKQATKDLWATALDFEPDDEKKFKYLLCVAYQDKAKKIKSNAGSLQALEEELTKELGLEDPEDLMINYFDESFDEFVVLEDLKELPLHKVSKLSIDAL